MLANYQQLHVEHGVDKVTIRRIVVELVAVITGKRTRTQQMTITRIKRLILFTEIYANGIVYTFSISLIFNVSSSAPKLLTWPKHPVPSPPAQNIIIMWEELYVYQTVTLISHLVYLPVWIYTLWKISQKNIIVSRTYINLNVRR